MKRKLLSLLLVSAMAVSVLGCGNDPAGTEVAGTDNGTEVAAETELDYVELNWYVNEQEMPDHAMVQAAMDEYFLEKLNCKVNLITIDNGTYTETMPTKIMSGDDIDMFAIAGNLDLTALAKAGAMYPMDELLDTYAPGTKALFKDEVWESIKKDGQIYTVPSLKDNCYIIGMTFNDTMAQALGIEYENLEYATFGDAGVEEFLEDAMAKRDAMFPEYAGKPILNDSRAAFIPFFFKAERLAAKTALAVTNIKGYEVDPTKGPDEVYNLYETEAFREFALKMQRWTEKGIIRHWDDTTNYFADPCILVRSGWGYTYVGEHQYSPDFVTKIKVLDGVWADQSSFGGSGVAIGGNCADPERAMMVIELMNTDPYIATLFRFGIEGEHWVYNAEGKKELTEKNSDSTNRSWFYWYGPNFGNLTIVEAPESLSGPDNIMLTRMEEYNSNAILSTHLSCVIDTTNFQNELAACNSVIAEYQYLIKGSLESADAVNKAVDEFVAKLKANGADKIVAEVQAQIDAWVAAQE